MHTSVKSLVYVQYVLTYLSVCLASYTQVFILCEKMVSVGIAAVLSMKIFCHY